MNTISSLIKNLRNRTPVGTIEMFAGASAPTDWLLCNGQAVSRATYSALFSLIGTTYGAGDGSTTFNVPDLRDRIAVGVSETKTLGSTGGEATHVHTTGNFTLQETHIPSHRHSVSAFNTGGNNGNTGSAGSHSHTTSLWNMTSAQAGAGGLYVTMVQGAGAANYGSSSAGSHTHSLNNHTHSVGAHNTNYTGGGSAHNHGNTGATSNYAPYTAINYIIYAGK